MKENLGSDKDVNARVESAAHDANECERDYESGESVIGLFGLFLRLLLQGFTLFCHELLESRMHDCGERDEKDKRENGLQK